MIYRLALMRLGLRLEGAAMLHEMSLPTVKNWSRGFSDPPPWAFDQLRAVEAHIQSLVPHVDLDAEPPEGYLDRMALVVAILKLSS
jgi:hypothetical protein